MSLAVIQHVARRFHLTPTAMLTRDRRALLVDARAIAAYIMHVHYPMSLPAIGRRLGGYDHSSIRNLVARARRMIDENPNLAEYVAEHLNAPPMVTSVEAFAPVVRQPGTTPPQITDTVFSKPAPPPIPKRARNVDDSEDGIRTESYMADANARMVAALKLALAA